MKLKKIVWILLFAVLFFGNCLIADARVCEYDGDLKLNFYKGDDGIYEVEATLGTKKKLFKPENSAYDDIYNFVNPTIITDDDTCLASLHVCYLMVVNQSILEDLAWIFGVPIYGAYRGFNDAANNTYRALAIFGASLDPESVEDPQTANFINPKGNEFSAAIAAGFGGGSGSTCKTISYIGDAQKTVQLCDTFLGYYNRLGSLYREYSDCDSNGGASALSCRSKAITKIHSLEDEIGGVCDRVMSSYDYRDACVSSCLSSKTLLKSFEKQYLGLGDESDCGFSVRLIIWIKNVLKWIKYILPVVVIILGMIDFIKAIASNKDDEMKKAQGNFIKRLIAAALTFIIPLIISFILEKMGFDATSCGLWS